VHEDLSRKDDLKVGSERSFGLVFAGVFAVIGLFPLFRSGDVRIWALALSALFLVISLVAPGVLRPLNIVWFRLGLMLHHITSPVILGLLFYGTIWPVALVYRMLGKDPLLLKFDRERSTYWIERNPPGPAPESMRRQF
jgi:hypothetical protein